VSYLGGKKDEEKEAVLASFIAIASYCLHQSENVFTTLVGLPLFKNHLFNTYYFSSHFSLG